MNFTLTREQEFVRKMVREFAEAEVAPIAAEIDAEHRFPEETVEKMAKYGMLGIPFPKEYGGDHVSYAITIVGDLYKIIPEMIAQWGDAEKLHDASAHAEN